VPEPNRTASRSPGRRSRRRSPGVVGISVTDQDDRPIAYVQFATTQTFASGSTPTIPIGGFTLVQTPLAAPQGGLTQYGWGRIADRYFGGVVLTPPSTGTSV